MQIGVPVHVNEAHASKIPPGSRHSSQRNGTVPTQDYRQRTGFYGLFDSRLQRFQGFANRWQVAGSRAIVIVILGKLDGIIAEVSNPVAY